MKKTKKIIFSDLFDVISDYKPPPSIITVITIIIIVNCQQTKDIPI